ncbi:hypothetical protein P4O66_022356 [Electrophorus voltai]|uniref:Uncharacterized protein n=1 Tax=Electrophorus voltai TaxID=2609070 RepID=A0AAD8ZP69_9TELE|nr:hypothetical protein P4O66_022356 [Electrophorus voltai]
MAVDPNKWSWIAPWKIVLWTSTQTVAGFQTGCEDGKDLQKQRGELEAQRLFQGKGEFCDGVGKRGASSMFLPRFPPSQAGPWSQCMGRCSEPRSQLRASREPAEEGDPMWVAVKEKECWSVPVDSRAWLGAKDSDDIWPMERNRASTIIMFHGSSGACAMPPDAHSSGGSISDANTSCVATG